MEESGRDALIARARARFRMSLFFLGAGIVYTISPIDLIPDMLVPIGWIDDLGILSISAIYSGISYHRLKRMRGGSR